MNKYISSFEFQGNNYHYCDLKKVFEDYPKLRKLPNSLKVLLELNLRNSTNEKLSDILKVFDSRNNLKTVEYKPNRVIMQDSAGLPTIIDLASMRDEALKFGLNSASINPKVMVDLVVESSSNKILEDEKNRVLKWAQNQFENLSVIPPGNGICHQVNLEYLATMIDIKKIDNKLFMYPETLIGTDIHTTLINALGVLGWGVGVLEAQKAMLGYSITLNLPKVVGVKIVGSLVQGVSINDAVLALTNKLNQINVSFKIVEFFGEGLKNISVEDRAIISSMATKYDAICGYFSVDDNTIEFVEQTRGVDASLIKEYYKKQTIFENYDSFTEYDEILTFDLSLVRPLVIGPRSLKDKISIEHIPSKLDTFKKGNFVKDNDVVLAAITSCTSTSNPSLLIQAGLLAKKAYDLELNINKNIKRVISFGSLAVKEYLKKLDLLKYFNLLGFDTENFNCEVNTQNIELAQAVELDIERFNLNVSSVASGNMNYEKKLHPLVKSNWYMSPALVIAYSLKGNMNFDITTEPILNDIYLSDLWPNMIEVNEYLEKIDYSIFAKVYKDIFLGNRSWQELVIENKSTYSWDKESTYIQPSNFFEKVDCDEINITDSKILALLDDDISTDDLLPNGRISPFSQAGRYLQSKGLRPDEFDSYENRRGNGEVMTRSLFSTSSLRNKIVLSKEGAFTKDFSTQEVLPIFDFSQKMIEEKTPLVVFAGSRLGIGRPRDWTAKAMKLLGVKAVIAKSFSKNYRRSLIFMGILPLEFVEDDINSLKLKGSELISINSSFIMPNEKIELEIKKENDTINITVELRLDSIKEVEYFKKGGVLSFFFNSLY
ncbi:MAG: aconitate hydratase AcnA [Campylobacterota bacterium]